jgi:leader peptidase (prepilin peptidase) / N-methyltransferase
MSRSDSAQGSGTATGARWLGWLRWLVASVPVTPLLRWLVLVHSVPSQAPWRHACPSCAAPVSPASGPRALRPPGRCSCGQRVGAPPYALEALTVLAGALVVVAAPGRSPLEVVAFGGWAAVAVALTFIDLAVHRLPDRLTLPAAAGVLVLLGIADLTGADGSWSRALAAAAACGLGFFLVTLVLGARAFGLGDAKLALSVGALLGWVGWPAVVAGLLLAFLTSGLVAAALLATRRVGWRDHLPFGPWLVAGTLLALAWLS